MTEPPAGTPAESIDNRETDLHAESFCVRCVSVVTIEEYGIGDDTEWVKASCECGDVVIHARVCPWPRDGMVVDDDGEWRVSEEGER